MSDDKKEAPKSVDEMSAKELLSYYQAKLDEEAREAKKAGKLVCWSASIAPPEMCVAMDIAMVYPETHSAGIGARKGSQPLLDIVEQQRGYSIDICSYARVNLGYMELLMEYAKTGVKPQKLIDSPAADVPLPDLVITCNNICNTLLKWYENIAKELNIPCIIIDVPFNHDMPVPEYAKDYLAEQIKEAAKQLETICGRPFDWDRFLEVQKQTQRSVEQWNRVARLAHNKPSPINGFDFFNYMALIVCARSLPYAEKTFRKFADEMEENLQNGKFALGDNEKHRVTWEGIAVWTYLGHTFKTLKGHGALMAGSAYPGMWNLTYTPGDLKSMGQAYTSVYINTCAENRARELTAVVRNSKSEGLVMHQNRSCKLMSLLNMEGGDHVRKELGVPYVIFDGDQTDPRNFAPAQFETRVQSLMEMIEKK